MEVILLYVIIRTLDEKALQEELYGSVVLMSPSINFLFHSII